METTLILEKEEQDAFAPELTESLRELVATGGQVKRLQTAILTRVRIARNAPDGKVTVNGTEYSRGARTVGQDGIGIVAKPGWTVEQSNPYRVSLPVNGTRRGVRWLVQEKSGAEHHLTAFDIKVDRDDKVYCLARYASLEAQGECITCADGTIVCGIDPYCS